MQAQGLPFALRQTRMTPVGLPYFNAVCTDVKVVFRLEPSDATTVMMATEIPAAIRPYSMAVAPDSAPSGSG